MPDKHALLSASASYRWLACPPSAMICASIPDTPSEFAKQGTDAHKLCEYKLYKALGRNIKDPRPNLDFLDEEMEESSDMYAQFVMEQLMKAKESCKDPMVMVEERVDFSHWVPGGFGTGDCIIAADGTLYIVDFKYGVGVLVEAEKNTQMMCYALGALSFLDIIYDIDFISMTIFQPRRNHVSTFVMAKEELLSWADRVLSPTAKLAAKGGGNFKAGYHCRFCKIKSTCRKRAEYNLEMAKYDFVMPDRLTDEEIEVILAKADHLDSWVKDVKEYALEQALNGKIWKRWKVVEGRSVRKYSDETAVADIVKNAGYDPYEHKVRGITNMTKMLGKKQFEELLSGLIRKPQGKPTLVSMSDKRPAMKNIGNDFKEEK